MQNRNYTSRSFSRKPRFLNESAHPSFKEPQSYNPNSIYILAAPGSYTYKFNRSTITNHLTYLDYENGGNKPIIVDWGDGMRDNRSTHTYYDSNEPRVIEIMNGVGLLDGEIDILNMPYTKYADDGLLTPFDKEHTIGALHICTFENTDEDHDQWAPLYGLFQGCKNLTYVAPGLLELCTDRTNIENLFSNCDSLTDVPMDLFAGFDMSQIYTDHVFDQTPIRQNPLTNNQANNQYKQTQHPYKYRSGDPDFEQDY